MDEVERLLGQLKSPDPKVRADAADTMREFRIQCAVRKLIRQLKAPDWNVRTDAAKALAKVGAPAVPALIGALKDDDRHVRRGAAWALGLTKDPRAVPSLTNALKDDDGPVRDNAIAALGSIGDSSVLPVLISALKDKDENVRQGAASALIKLAEAADIELPRVAESLQDYANHVKKKGSPEEKEKARVWTTEVYKEISQAVAKKKQAQMPGILSSGTVPKPSGKKIYRTGRDRVVA